MLTVSSLCVLFAAAQSQIHSASDLLDGAIVEEKMKGGVLRSLWRGSNDSLWAPRTKRDGATHQNDDDERGNAILIQGKEGKQTHESCIKKGFSVKDLEGEGFDESNFAATLDILANTQQQPCVAEINGIIERIKTDIIARAQAGWKDIKYSVDELQEILPPYFYEFTPSEYARGFVYPRFVSSGLEKKLKNAGLHVRFCSVLENAMFKVRYGKPVNGDCRPSPDAGNGSRYIKILQICLNENCTNENLS